MTQATNTPLILSDDALDAVSGGRADVQSFTIATQSTLSQRSRVIAFTSTLLASNNSTLHAIIGNIG